MYCGWILKNGRIQKTVNATAPFSMESLDISGFEGQQFLNICWRYINLTVKLNCRPALQDRGSARGRTKIVKSASNLAQDRQVSSSGML